MGICRRGLGFCLPLFLLWAATVSPVWAGGRAPSAVSTTKGTLRKAPSFELLNLQGETVRFEDYAGKVILLDFWASWCPPCQEEIPHFIEVYRQYQAKGFVILGVSVGDSRQSVERFVKQRGVNYPVLLGNEAILGAYPGIYFLPTAFLIDRKGMIREKLIGYVGKEELEGKILPLLEAP